MARPVLHAPHVVCDRTLCCLPHAWRQRLLYYCEVPVNFARLPACAFAAVSMRASD